MFRLSHHVKCSFLSWFLEERRGGKEEGRKGGEDLVGRRKNCYGMYNDHNIITEVENQQLHVREETSLDSTQARLGVTQPCNQASPWLQG